MATTTPLTTPSSSWSAILVSLPSPITSSTTTTTTTTITTSVTTSSTYTSSSSLNPTTTSFQPTSATHSSTAGISSTALPTGGQAPQPVASGSGFSTGTLTGAIVGSFLGGCIIAFLIAFLLLRRRKRTPSSSKEGEYSASGLSESPNNPAKSPNKVPDSTVSTEYDGISYVASNATSLDLTPYISESADDTTICMRIQTFFDQVGLHIDNFYSRPDSVLQLNQEDTARISEYGSPFLGAPLASLLSNTRAQRTVLTHALVHTLVQSIHPGAQTRSLLPPCYSLGQGSQEIKTLISDDRAMFAWRILTSHLYNRGQVSHSADLAVHNDVIAKIADDFSRTFAPFGDSRFPQADRLAHLHTVVREASGLGTWLIAQPCSFEFHWSTASKTSKYIAVLPSVVKVYDEQGRHLAVPQTLLAETKAQI